MGFTWCDDRASVACVRLRPIADIGHYAMLETMRHLSPVALALLISSCGTLPAPTSMKPLASEESHFCEGRLERLQETELVNLLVGARMRYADDNGICPEALRITSAWEQEFRKGGDLLIRADRANLFGRYTITGDIVCTTIASRTTCQHLYRDEFGSIYEEGSADGRTVAVKVSIPR
jgi:hypothetical protein